MKNPPISTAAVRFSPAARWGATAGLVFVTGLGAGVSCKTTTINEEHCYYNRGNDTCAQRYGGELPYCATFCAGKDGNPASPNEDGCVDWQPPEGCYSPCGSEKDVSEDSTCLDIGGTESGGPTSGTTMGTSESETAGGTETVGTTETQGSETGPSGCETSGDCVEAETPICGPQGVCLACGESGKPTAECAAKDPDFPACSESGACVECTSENENPCVGTTPVCENEECRGCVAHEECAETACAYASGECFPGGCEQEVPGEYGTIQAAVNAVADEGFCVVRVGEAGAIDYVGSVVIDGGKRIALLNGGATEVVVQGVGGTPTLGVSGGSEAYVEGLRFGGNGSGAGMSLSGNGSRLYVDRSEVVDNNGGGVEVLSGGYLRLANSTVGGNGAEPAVAVESGTAELIYATAVGTGLNGRVLTCGVGGSSSVRNSLLFGEDDADEVTCANIEVTYSASEQDLGGEGNESVLLSTASFANFLAADFHLSIAGAGMVANVARWTTGDPLLDLDGDARAGVDGTMEHAGADVP